ncbi:ImmA/IrrE family metallo-endopeptidase, partial [Pseudodesulfovibrio pelocollis]|uniref:ImmA/IrrE family metallo-endopeptidase n=1 Tax=Pseudodesulfovibrio pelocollis TaxID=3051432 RepID=UPI00255AAE54
SPFDLAEQIGLTIVPSSSINDARVVARKDGCFQIEFNPNAPKARRNFSIAHEIVHTLFPDCGARVRNRELKTSKVGDGWELEMLCNVGAAELLMPIGSFPAIKDETLTIKNILRLRREYEVSTEAVMLRAVRLTDAPCVMFASSLGEGQVKFKIDYSSPSPSFPFEIQKQFEVPARSGVAGCKAIGYTYSGREVWSDSFGELDIECVGIPPYPGQRAPRVVGVAKALSQASIGTVKIAYMTGDATKPYAQGSAIIAHIVNDKAKRWGGRGFAYHVSKVWPEVYDDFVRWREQDPLNFVLGKARLLDVSDNISVFTLIAQHGYGYSSAPRIRYQALASGLDDLYNKASKRDASVHMPRVGCGHGGGDWAIVSEMIEDKLTRRGVPVTVYDPPN